MRTRMSGGVGAGRLTLPATRLSTMASVRETQECGQEASHRGEDQKRVNQKEINANIRLLPQAFPLPDREGSPRQKSHN